jgi:hypothetical protein
MAGLQMLRRNLAEEEPLRELDEVSPAIVITDKQLISVI